MNNRLVLSRHPEVETVTRKLTLAEPDRMQVRLNGDRSALIQTADCFDQVDECIGQNTVDAMIGYAFPHLVSGFGLSRLAQLAAQVLKRGAPLVLVFYPCDPRQMWPVFQSGLDFGGTICAVDTWRRSNEPTNDFAIFDFWYPVVWFTNGRPRLPTTPPKGIEMRLDDLFSVLVRVFTRPGDLVCDPAVDDDNAVAQVLAEGRRFLGITSQPYMVRRLWMQLRRRLNIEASEQ